MSFSVLNKHLSHTEAEFFSSLKCESKTHNILFLLHNFMDRNMALAIDIINLNIWFFLIKWRTSTFSLKKALHDFSLAHPNFQHRYFALQSRYQAK
jgi:hypothetical protein